MNQAYITNIIIDHVRHLKDIEIPLSENRMKHLIITGKNGSGKTSLVEAMLYVSGVTNRMGKVTESNTVSDFDKEEQKRGFSISTSLVPIEWEKAKINILDTPGA